MIIRNSICEFDIKNAGITILYEKGILTKKEYLYYINLDKDRKKAFLVGLSTRVNKDKYNDGIYLVNIEGEVIGLR